MISKEDQIARLKYLTEREMKLNERSLESPTSELYEEVENVHQSRMKIWREITRINFNTNR